MVRELVDSANRVNTRCNAVITGYDHVEAKCAHLVERNPAVVISTVWDRRKQRAGTPESRDLIDQGAVCQVNVRRSPCPQAWRDSHVSFFALTNIARNRCERSDHPKGADLIDLWPAVLTHEQLGGRNGDAGGKALIGKEHSIGGVKESSGREEHYNYQTNSYSGFHFYFTQSDRETRSLGYFTFSAIRIRAYEKPFLGSCPTLLVLPSPGTA